MHCGSRVPVQLRAARSSIGLRIIRGCRGPLHGVQPVLAANATTTGLTSSQNPSAFGQPVALEPWVESPAGLPSGSVGFRRVHA
jgi:hypothetical protein